MLELLSKGGFLVVPILACSVLAVAVFAERLVVFYMLSRRGKKIAGRVSSLIESGRIDEARKAAATSRSPMGRILAQGLDVAGQDSETMETVLVNALDKEVRGLARHLQVLATIANISPLLGLLGTVIGMIKAFMVIQEMGGRVNATVLAGGIWEAMLTTALGLAVALPAMLAHSYLVARVEAYEARLKDGMVVFVKSLAQARGR